MPIVRLTDGELDAIMSAARPLQASRRDAFLQHVASSLKHRGELGPGVVYRVVAEVQRECFDPSDLSRSRDQSKWLGEVAGGGCLLPHMRGSERLLVALT